MPLSLQTMGGFRAVTTLPADASTYGTRVLYYKYPVVASLPATVVNDARYVLDATKVEYLGRSVVELEGSDNISLPVLDEYFGNFAEIKVNFRDLVSGGPPTGSRVFLEAGAIVCYVLDTGDFWADLINTSGYQGSVGVIGVNICDGLNHQLTINFTDTCVFITADGVQSSCITTDGFSYNPIAYINVNTADDISPLQICCIQQSLNGVLIDSIPCDETTGTTLRNTVSPDRPATLSDATAHALAWVAQSAPTLTVWINNPVSYYEKKELILDNYSELLTGVGASGFDVTWHQAIRISESQQSGIRFSVKNIGTSPLTLNGAIVATSNVVNNNGLSSVGNAVTEDGATGWVTAKFSGLGSVVIGVGESIQSDLVSVSTIAPLDGGKHIYLVKVSFEDNDGMAYAFNGTQDISESFVLCGYKSPSTLDPSVELTEIAQYIVLNDVTVYLNSKEITATSFGDSISNGFGSTSGKESWFDRLTSISNKVKYAISGTTSDQYVSRLKSKSGYESICFYPPYTPNDSNIPLTLMERYQNAVEAIQFCKANKTLCVLVNLAPDNRLDATADQERLDLFLMLSNYPTLNIIESINTGAMPDRFGSGNAADQIHPSELGYSKMATEADILIANLISGSIWLPT